MLLHLLHHPGLLCIIPIKRHHYLFESVRANDVDKLLSHVAFVKVFEKNEVILLALDGYEGESKCLRSGLNTQAGIDESTGNGDGDGHVCGVLAFISLNPFWFDFEFAKFVIKEDARSRAGLTVDERDIFAREVLDPFDLLGIALRNNQPLLADHQVYNNDFREQLLLLEVGAIVDACGQIEP